MRLFVLAVPVLLLASQRAVASADTTLLSMAPSSSTVLAGIDVRRSAASRSGSRMLGQTTDDPALATLIRNSGLNVRRDIRQMLLVEVGRGDGSPHALIANGSFSPARLIAAARARGGSLKKIYAVPVVVQGRGKTAACIAFPRSGILVMGDPATVYAVIAPRRASKGIASDLRDEVNRIGPTNDVWFATDLPGSFIGEQIGDAMPSALRRSEFLDRIERSCGGLQFGQTDRVTINLVGRTSSDARLISGVLRLSGGLAHLQFGGKPGLVLAGNVLSSMRIAVEGSTVEARSAVLDRQIEEALAPSN